MNKHSILDPSAQFCLKLGSLTKSRLRSHLLCDAMPFLAPLASPMAFLVAFTHQAGFQEGPTLEFESCAPGDRRGDLLVQLSLIGTIPPSSFSFFLQTFISLALSGPKLACFNFSLEHMMCSFSRSHAVNSAGNQEGDSCLLSSNPCRISTALRKAGSQVSGVPRINNDALPKASAPLAIVGSVCTGARSSAWPQRYQ